LLLKNAETPVDHGLIKRARDDKNIKIVSTFLGQDHPCHGFGAHPLYADHRHCSPENYTPSGTLSVIPGFSLLNQEMVG
jgi:hypothetical protein